MRRYRNTKIVATLGPNADQENILSGFVERGVDVFRFNMSHGDHPSVEKRHKILRDLETEFSRPICILADLQGPKLRCGDFEGTKLSLEKGQKFCFDPFYKFLIKF